MEPPAVVLLFSVDKMPLVLARVGGAGVVAAAPPVHFASVIASNITSGEAWSAVKPWSKTDVSGEVGDVVWKYFVERRLGPPPEQRVPPGKVVEYFKDWAGITHFRFVDAPQTFVLPMWFKDP